jgi:putative salt-induced outer membrane protein YdiY
VFIYLKSDQQDLDARTTYGFGPGKELVRTNRSVFQLFGGMDYSHEKYFPSAGPNNIKNSLEGLIGARYATFRFKTLDLSWNGTMYPSFTDAPRVRFATNGNVKIELVKDLYWSFSLYENYDTHPPVNAPKNDFGLTTSLGYRF